MVRGCGLSLPLFCGLLAGRYLPGTAEGDAVDLSAESRKPIESWETTENVDEGFLYSVVEVCAGLDHPR